MCEEVEVTVKWQGNEYSISMLQEQTVADMKRRLAGVKGVGGEISWHFVQMSKQARLLANGVHRMDCGEITCRCSDASMKYLLQVYLNKSSEFNC
jgi:hypothetical protein